MIDRNESSKTDKNGVYLIDKQTGFCFDPVILFSKKGYKPFQIKIESEANANKYQVKVVSQAIDLEEPYYPDSTDKSTFILATWVEKYSKNFHVKSDSLVIYLDVDKLIN